MNQRFEQIELECIAEHFENILNFIDDPTRTDGGTDKTPMRVAKAFGEMTYGYEMDPEAILSEAKFEVGHSDSDLVIVKDIDFVSLCEHHILPFFGKVHIGYIPGKYVGGLSKFPRVVKAYSKRLQVQERICRQIAEAIEKHLEATAVGVIIEAKHLCMCGRGVESVNAITTSSCMHGLMRENQALRDEFISLVKL